MPGRTGGADVSSKRFGGHSSGGLICAVGLIKEGRNRRSRPARKEDDRQKSPIRRFAAGVSGVLFYDIIKNSRDFIAPAGAEKDRMFLKIPLRFIKICKGKAV